MQSRLVRMKLTIVVLFVGLAILLVSRSDAGHGCCSQCGCVGECFKVCRLVEEEKKVEIVCWGTKCEDFCLSCPSQRGCRHCELACETCGDHDPKAPNVAPKRLVWNEWFPTSAKVYTKKKLMKKTETKKIPSFKWVVEELCEQCEANCLCADVPADVVIPPPPTTNAKIKYPEVR